MKESTADKSNLPAKLAASLKNAAKHLVPERLLKERGIVLRLGPGAGKIYARLRALDVVGANRMTEKLAPQNARSVLFVCFGNIMRSPMAEALLKRTAEEEKIEIAADSAGLHAVPGNQAHAWAQAAASEMGISLADHRAKLLTSEQMERADVVFAMDLQNLAELLNAYPQCRDKIFMLSAYAGKRMREIPDPYFGDLDATRECYRVLQICVRNFLASRAIAR